ncbi:MAG: hypothetical protein VKP72_09170 [bacterium]|nr:hypothetical protein [bacterium]
MSTSELPPGPLPPSLAEEPGVERMLREEIRKDDGRRLIYFRFESVEEDA